MTKLMKIEALDHFSQQRSIDDPLEERCILTMIGEFVKENEDYIFLRHKTWKSEPDDGNHILVHDIHAIIKKTILRVNDKDWK